jgi:PAS domain S-box-containing protein
MNEIVAPVQEPPNDDAATSRAHARRLAPVDPAGEPASSTLDDRLARAPLRLLLVEDSPGDGKLVVHALRRQWPDLVHERVETAAAMASALKSPWDLVISDWSMPGFSGAVALALLKEARLDLPFIIVSGTVGEEAAVEAMRSGAHDYVLKDKLSRLVPAVERELREQKERRARRRAEDALRASEARFRRLAESGVVGIVIAEGLGRVHEANDVFLKLVGYTRAEVERGELVWSARTPAEYAYLDELAVERLRESGVAPPWETMTRRKDGNLVPVLVGVATLEHPRTIWFIADLTDRQHAEEARNRLALEATNQKAELARTEEALRRSEEQLRHAQKMEAVGRFAGGVAHDFNNVLSVILSYSELIAGDLQPGDPVGADIEEIRKAAARAAALTRQLLMFSRQQVVEPQVMDLGDVLVDLEKMIRRIVGEDVELTIRASKDAGRVKVDPSHIEQVILNLVVNARDAMPTGGKLTLETEGVVLDEEYALRHLPTRAGPHVMLAITDTGVGMDRATQARIFEPFFTTKGIGKGTGLGLSTVFGIVQQSGGNVWVYSEPGIGTTFKVYLPRVDAAVEVRKAASAPKTLRGTETVLLVEDEEQVRAIVANILRRQGYRVVVAQHPLEALRMSAELPDAVHLLLTDVVMPQMSGPELAKRLALARPSMRVLCMSGYTDDSIVRHGVIDSAMAFLQKPFTPASLTKKVREVLDGGEAGRAPRSPRRDRS